MRAEVMKWVGCFSCGNTVNVIIMINLEYKDKTIFNTNQIYFYKFANFLKCANTSGMCFL